VHTSLLKAVLLASFLYDSRFENFDVNVSLDIEDCHMEGGLAVAIYGSFSSNYTTNISKG